MTLVSDAARLRRAWEDGRAARGVWSSLADPVAGEVVGASPFDYVCVDLQHGHAHEATLDTLLQAMRLAGRAPLVRVAWNETARIMRALDAGASGVVVPFVSTPQDAVRAAAACRFPPTGERSWGPAWSDARAVRKPAEQDDDVVCVVMVETPQAVEQAAAIAAVDGVDAVYVGPNDLALTCGHGRATYRDSAAVDALLRQVVEAGLSVGTPVGIHCSDVEMAAYWTAAGASMVTVAQDSTVLRDGLAEAFSG